LLEDGVSFQIARRKKQYLRDSTKRKEKIDVRLTTLLFNLKEKKKKERKKESIML